MSPDAAECRGGRIRALCLALGGGLVLGLAGLSALLAETPVASAAMCPPNMASVLGRFCIDRYEASVDVVDENGATLRRHSPYHSPSPGQRLVARSRRNVVPQAHFSRMQAEAACIAAGKRLCTDSEWVTACRGRQPTRYPYGDQWERGRCNDEGVSPLLKFHGRDESVATFGFEAMNDPRLNQVPGSVARTGQFRRCRNSFGIYDMVGNLHEWTAARTGIFRGGYYLDTETNGKGCEYTTAAHSPAYHDYSIGFRCCADLGGARRTLSGRGPEPKRTSHTDKPRYMVQSGDTLGRIAKQHGVSVEALCKINDLDRREPIHPGQQLKIP